MRHVAVVFLIFTAAAYPQAPVISPGGVVNAASYTAGIAPGSLASLFGSNLANDTLTPDPLLLTTRLGGATVTVGGVPAYLHYVSPTNLIFEMPVAVIGPTTLTVSTPAGTTPAYPITAADAFGVFTLGTAGCGPADALNADGSLNSPSNSVSPGDTLAIFGTGLFPITPAPTDGYPAPSNPLGIYTGATGGTTFDIDGPFSAHLFAGIAPGWVALDQVNVRVPDSAREGCAVPLLITTGESGNTRPVTVSIHKGGGQCIDPPAVGYGSIEWRKTLITGSGPFVERDEVTVSFQQSPGKRKPKASGFVIGAKPVMAVQNFGPACPVPGYRSMDAGIITAQGVQTEIAQFSPPEGSQIAGLTEYHAELAPGTIQPGEFSIAATGGSDVKAFQSTIQIGSGIDITTPLPPGTVLDRQAPLVIRWSDNTPDNWVTLKLISHHGTYDQYLKTQVPVSDGLVSISSGDLAGLPAGPVEVDIEVDPVQQGGPNVINISLEVNNTWKYQYRLLGIVLI